MLPAVVKVYTPHIHLKHLEAFMVKQYIHASQLPSQENALTWLWSAWSTLYSVSTMLFNMQRVTVYKVHMYSWANTFTWQKSLSVQRLSSMTFFPSYYSYIQGRRKRGGWHGSCHTINLYGRAQPYQKNLVQRARDKLTQLTKDARVTLSHSTQ